MSSKVPTGVVRGATGKYAPSYYSDAAAIVADSASRQSQLLASQSALAMQTMASVGQSLSEGFAKVLDYKTTLRALDFDRELKLREAERLDQAMDMQRLQLEDEHLSRQKDLMLKTMEIAQKKRDIDNVPLLAKARAETAAIGFMVRQAAAKIAAGTATDDDRNTVEGAFGMLGLAGQEVIRLGGSPAEIDQLQSQIVPLVREATSVTLSNGASLQVRTARSMALNPNSADGAQVIIDSVIAPDKLEPLTLRNAGYTRQLLANPSAYLGEGGLNRLLALASMDANPEEAKKAAEQAYRYVSAMPVRERDLLRARIVQAGGLGKGKMEEFERYKGMGMSDTASLAALEGATESEAEVWSGNKNVKPIRPVVPRKTGGTRSVDPDVLARLGYEGRSVRDYFAGGIRGYDTQLLGGDLGPMDNTAASMTASVMHPLFGTSAVKASEAVMRFVNDEDREQVRRKQRETADNYVMLAAEAAHANDFSMASDYLNDLERFVQGVSKYGDIKADAVISSEAAATIRRIYILSARSEGGRGYNDYFGKWLSTNAPKLAFDDGVLGASIGAKPLGQPVTPLAGGAVLTP